MRRPTQPLMGAIHLGQQGDVGLAVAPHKAMAPIGAGSDLARLPVLPNQPGHLRLAQARHLAEIGPDHPALLLAPAAVLLVDQHPLHPSIDFLAALPAALDLLAGSKKLGHLGRRQRFGVLHAYLHLRAGCPARRPSARSNSVPTSFHDHLALETDPVS